MATKKVRLAPTPMCKKLYTKLHNSMMKKAADVNNHGYNSDGTHTGKRVLPTMNWLVGYDEKKKVIDSAVRLRRDYGGCMYMAGISANTMANAMVKLTKKKKAVFGVVRAFMFNNDAFIKQHWKTCGVKDISNYASTLGKVDAALITMGPKGVPYVEKCFHGKGNVPGYEQYTRGSLFGGVNLV